MKKTVCLAAVLAALLTMGPVPALADAEPPETSAAAYIVTEADTGDVLAQKNADDRRLIASTTKIMTALVVLERCDIDETVTIDPTWTGIEGSSMYLRAGQELTVRELLYGLMLASGNDAAVALACVAAGDIDSFAALMNERAAALGCENTHFSNPNGLDAPDHYSSARDLAIITAEAIESAAFREIVSCAVKTIGENTFSNHNRLLTECEGVFGVKTGYTEAAGRSLVTCCERDGVTLICVTLSDPDDWADHTALYDWAFSQYDSAALLTGGERWAIPVIGGTADEVSVRPAGPLTVTLRGEDTASVTIRLPAFVYADVQGGAPAGEAIALVGGREAGRVALLYEETVPRAVSAAPTFKERLLALFGRGERGIYTLE